MIYNIYISWNITQKLQLEASPEQKRVCVRIGRYCNHWNCSFNDGLH